MALKSEEKSAPERVLSELPKNDSPVLHVVDRGLNADFIENVLKLTRPKITQIIRPQAGNELPDSHSMARMIEGKIKSLYLPQILLFPPQKIYNAAIHKLIMLLTQNDPCVNPDFYRMDGKGCWEIPLKTPKKRETEDAAEYLSSNYEKIQDGLLAMRSRLQLFGMCCYGRLPFPMEEGLKSREEASEKKAVCYRLSIDQAGRPIGARFYGEGLGDMTKLDKAITSMRNSFCQRRFFHTGETKSLSRDGRETIEEVDFSSWDPLYANLLMDVHKDRFGKYSLDGWIDNSRFVRHLGQITGSRHAAVNFPGLGQDRREFRRKEAAALKDAAKEVNLLWKDRKEKSISPMLASLKEKFGSDALHKLRDYVYICFDKTEGLVIEENEEALQNGSPTDYYCLVKTDVKSKVMDINLLSKITRMHLKAREEFEIPFREGQLEVLAPGSVKMKANGIYALLLAYLRHHLIECI
jgi:hypothetical protein